MADGDRPPINGTMHPVQMERPHDISFDLDKSLMRTVLTKGSGDDCREGGSALLHFSVHSVAAEGELAVFDSTVAHPHGVRVAVGLDRHAEVLHRAVLNVQPGAVLDVVCTDDVQARDPLLLIEPPALCERAVQRIVQEQRRGFATRSPSVVPEHEAELRAEAAAWSPPATQTRWHIRIDSCTEGVVPCFITWPEERLQWVTRQKNFGAELFAAAEYARAGRRYKKAILDLEVPAEWTEQTNIARNTTRCALHLNIAQCALKTGAWDDALAHATRALKIDPHSVKALYRRALAHMRKPGHANGLTLAQEDLTRAAALEPTNREVAKMLGEARQAQRGVDRDQKSVFSKMISAGEQTK